MTQNLSPDEIKYQISQLSKAEKRQVAETTEKLNHDSTKGLVRLEQYVGTDLNLANWKLTSVLDDILMCQFADINEDGTEILRGKIWIPINAVQHAWRVGKVLLAGPRANVKVGDHVIFPSTMGLKVSNLNGLRHIVFLNEDRIFGICEPDTTLTN